MPTRETGNTKESKGHFLPNSTVCGKYKIVRELGYDHWLIYYEAVGPMGAVIVEAPRVPGHIPPNLVIQQLKTARNVLKRFNHPHIVKYIDECDVGELPVLMIEPVYGSPLVFFEGQLDVDVALKLGVKLAEVLQYLHRNGIIHRDFCIGSIILRNNNPLDPVVVAMLLVNIGRITRPGAGIRLVGEDCSPPELAYQGIAVEASDIYMWGTIMMKVVKRRYPWRSLGSIMTFTSGVPKLKGEPCDFIDCGAYANVLNKVLSKALDPDYTKRYQSVDELLRELEVAT